MLVAERPLDESPRNIIRRGLVLIRAIRRVEGQALSQAASGNNQDHDRRCNMPPTALAEYSLIPYPTAKAKLTCPAPHPARDQARPPPPTRAPRRHPRLAHLPRRYIGDQWGQYGMGEMGKDRSFRLLDAFYAAGGNFVDTANTYQDETSERFLGEWMATRGVRDQMVVATKVRRCAACWAGSVPC
ncbi:predicted protein [Postia placenta Mad-698-R]|nr:predicted protein [Postia placenta Mad-698-R]